MVKGPEVRAMGSAAKVPVEHLDPELIVTPLVPGPGT